jgi:hypothetical protein
LLAILHWSVKVALLWLSVGLVKAVAVGKVWKGEGSTIVIDTEGICSKYTAYEPPIVKVTVTSEPAFKEIKLCFATI